MSKPLIEPGILAALKTRIGNFTAALAGFVPASGGGTTNYLRADGTWAAPAGGGGGANDGLITAGFDGQGATVTAGSWIMVRMPYDGTIDGAYLTGDGQTGSAVVDVRRDTRANIPPTGADSICASAKPTISSAKYADDTTLTGWSTTFAAGDALIVYVESCATFQKLELQLTVVRT